ncbi:putative nucleotidyltransferase substrate binding domain-containing protein [Actibacterium atlanticum]|nr:putative nucleotidyltransferase substrate binding domain-containing protein [Actibacterium atlanticum]
MQHAPFDLMPAEAGSRLAPSLDELNIAPGDTLFQADDPIDCLYVVIAGAIELEGRGAEVVARRDVGAAIGERALLRHMPAVLTARAAEASTLITIPRAEFANLVSSYPDFATWFERAARSTPVPETASAGLTALQVADLMVPNPISCDVSCTVTDIARKMRDNKISSVLLMQDDDLAGIVTTRDLTNKVLAEGLPGTLPVSNVMTSDPVTIAPNALGLDALMRLAENRISHMPVLDHGNLVGVIGSTDLFRQQASTASHMVAEIVRAGSADEMAEVMKEVPGLLVQLVLAGTRHEAITRRITDITDAITRRLLALAEEKYGPPPVPYLFLACGSQGRREQTGVSDQDNCLIIDDAMKPEDDAYFKQLAQYVSDGLNTCGFIYCPGDMMATADRWRQPLRVWKQYFEKWIAKPDTEAQMLASVMFDLRPIGGSVDLFEALQHDTLEKARSNSIFVAHMISNSLKHTVPLGMFRGFALIRSGEHKNQFDMKHSGVVPVVDLGRVYALQGALEAVNTRERLEAARDAGVISTTGAHDLIDAYDLIAETRLRHQADQIRGGGAPDNFMAPDQLSDLERSHLRDAFTVIKTMQSALGSSRGA